MQTDSSTNDNATPLEPIKTGVFETPRIIKKSYNSPLEHCQTMQKNMGMQFSWW